MVATLSVSLRSDSARHPLAHEWQLLNGKHWQIVSRSVEDASVTDAAEKTRGACLPGMVSVKGRSKLDVGGAADRVDLLQRETCTDWIDRAFPERCAHFDRNEWLKESKNLPTRELDFCIDRFEYPNRRGAYPWVMVTWRDASELCRQDGKRLCTEAEWTFACEGEEAMPYPYGYDRDDEACVADRPWREANEAALEARAPPVALAEIDRLWQGEASGERPRCRSPLGVYDLTGNVDEWTASVVHGERPSILKGGYWGPVRTRCRPSTRAHGEEYASYQEGLRCCADDPAASPRHD